MLITPLIAFVAGVCLLQLQAELPSPAWLTATAVAAVGSAIAALRSRLPAGAAVVLLCAGAALAGWSYAGGRAQLRLADALPFADEGRDVLVTGVVASLPVRLERGLRFEFDVESHGPEAAVPSRVLLGWYDAGRIVQPGERWRFVVRLRRPHGTLNPAGYDFEAWMFERGLRASGYVRSGSPPAPQRLQAMVWTPLLAVERARAWLRDRLESQLRSQSGSSAEWNGVLVALVLGDQRAIARDQWALFNRTGITHLVSISGLHITMIAALAGALVGLAWRRVPALLARLPAQTAGIAAGLLAALAYALLAGWAVPAQRTVLMLAAVAAAWLMRGRMTPGVALALAAFAVCAIDPWAVTAVGFWLSFGAVAAIVWVVHGRPLPRRAIAWTALKTAARVQIAVTLALIPATVLLFQQVSLVAPLANALAIPLVSWIVTPLALLGAVAAALPWPLATIAHPLLAIAGAVFSGLALALQALAAPAWAAVAVPTAPLVLVVLAIGGVAWLLAPPGWPLRPAGVAALLPLFVWPGERPAEGALWVTALDVGQGTAVVVETRDRVWLYDAGPRYSQQSDAGERIVLPYLRSRGIAALDGFVVSHLDQDHSGGAASVLRSLPVRRLLSSVASGHAALNGAAAERCVAGLHVAGELDVRVLHPAAADYDAVPPKSPNAMSCVVRLQRGDTRVLLTGDIPLAAEAALLNSGADLRAQWMLVPHHGSRSSSGVALLAAVRPQTAAVQAGYRNRFGHPDPQVQQRYAGQGAQLIRTDHGGAVQWRFTPRDEPQMRVWRASAVRYWHNRPAVGQPHRHQAPESLPATPADMFWNDPYLQVTPGTP